MPDTHFLRSDELPADAALGYLFADGTQTNVDHLPVIGSGDGGAYSTLADVHTMWRALFEGRIVSTATLERMTRPRSDVPKESKRYGAGFWLAAEGPGVILEGYDAGVSFRTMHDPDRALTHTVVSNWTDGAWPLARYLISAF